MDKSTMGSGKPLTLILVNILAARCLKIVINSYLFYDVLNFIPISPPLELQLIT